MLFDSEIDRAIRAGTPLTETAQWKALEAHCCEIGDVHMRELFSADPGRFDRFSLAGQRRAGSGARDVLGREDQLDRGQGCASCGAAQPCRRTDRDRR